MIQTHVFPSPAEANAAAAELLIQWMTAPGFQNLMLAAGNTPLDLYQLVSTKNFRSDQLQLFSLDEYVGVPPDEPRTCANLLRDRAARPWGIPPAHYHTLSSCEEEALSSVLQHEQKIRRLGGLHGLVLGLGKNGHLGFNEPGSPRDSIGRTVPLEPISVESNRQWFGGDYAPAKGVTVGLQTILQAKRIMILAFGSHKAHAVQQMIEGTVGPQCPASFLQEHSHVHAFLDTPAVAQLKINHSFS